jgi:hypothetical protein
MRLWLTSAWHGWRIGCQTMSPWHTKCRHCGMCTIRTVHYGSNMQLLTMHRHPSLLLSLRLLTKLQATRRPALTAHPQPNGEAHCIPAVHRALASMVNLHTHASHLSMHTIRAVNTAATAATVHPTRIASIRLPHAHAGGRALAGSHEHLTPQAVDAQCQWPTKQCSAAAPHASGC